MGETIRLRDMAKQNSTAVISGALKDGDGEPVVAAQLSAVEWTLYDGDGSVVNEKQDVDILNANGGSIDSSGILTLSIPGTDHAISAAGLSSGVPYEWRTAVIKKVWAGSTDYDSIRYRVANLHSVS